METRKDLPKKYINRQEHSIIVSNSTSLITASRLYNLIFLYSYYA